MGSKLLENLQVRAAEQKDAEAIYGLIKAWVQGTGEADDFSLKVEDLSTPLGIVGISTIDGKNQSVLGVALYHIKYSTWEGAVMHLNTFIVDDKHRRLGIGTKLLQSLAQIAEKNNYTRISFEVPNTNVPASTFFSKHGALNLTKEEEWLNYEVDGKSLKPALAMPIKTAEGFSIRRAVKKDCAKIKGFIQDLAEYEKMHDGPKLQAEDLERDLDKGYISFVPEFKDPGSGTEEIVGYCLFFPTFSPVNGRRVHLEDLYVTPNYRDKHVGQVLFREIMKFVEEGEFHGFSLEVLAWNTTAIRFYEKFNLTNLTQTKGLESYRFRKDIIQVLANT